MSESKAAFRIKISAQLEKLQNREDKSKKIQHNLLANSFLKNVDTVFSYIAHKTEVSTSDIHSTLLQINKRLVIPYISEGSISLFLYQNEQELSPGFGGILGPKRELRSLTERGLNPNQVELFIVPGLAFDRFGTRLGKGAGHFDKLLAKASKEAVFIGLAYQLQLLDTLPKETHDIQMRWIITEEEVFKCQ